MEALLVYQAALDLYERPAILYNIAQTYEKLRNPAQAALAFERYLDLYPRAMDREAVQNRIARLKKTAKVGVHITSYPPGAAIYVGNRSEGVKGRTPFFLQLPLGEQRITLELTGFIPETRSILVELGRRNLIDVQLQKKSSIKVDADIPGAIAFIDSDTPKQGLRVPQFFEVDPGKHMVHVHLQGYQPVQREVIVKPGDQISLLVNLIALPKYGRFQVEGVPAATLIIEGKIRAHLPMARSLKLAAGTYRVMVSREGYRSWAGKININPNRLTTAQVTLTPLRGAVTQSIIYGSMGVSVASLITGAVFGALALRSEREFNAVPTSRNLDAGKQQALAADACFAAAGAAALAMVVTFLATRRGPSEAEMTFSAIPSMKEAPR